MIFRIQPWLLIHQTSNYESKTVKAGNQNGIRKKKAAMQYDTNSWHHMIESFGPFSPKEHDFSCLRVKDKSENSQTQIQAIDG